jgi:hypothetical protein
MVFFCLSDESPGTTVTLKCAATDILPVHSQFLFTCLFDIVSIIFVFENTSLM